MKLSDVQLKRIALIFGVAIAIALVVACMIWLPLDDILNDALEVIAGWGPWVGVGLVGLMILHNLLPIPAEMIAVFAGAVCGVIVGTVVIWIGAMIGAALAFWIARRFGRSRLTGDKTAPLLARLDRLVASGDWRGLLMVRLIPIVSFNLVNYGAGLADVGWWTFLWTTAIGILPLTIISVFAGAGFHLMGPVTSIAIILAIAVGLSFFKWRRRL